MKNNIKHILWIICFFLVGSLASASDWEYSPGNVFIYLFEDQNYTFIAPWLEHKGVNVTFNETHLNLTIDNRVGIGSFVDVTWDNVTYDADLYTNLSTLMQDSANITCAYASGQWNCHYNGSIASGATEAWVRSRFVNVSWVNWTEAIGNLSSIGNWTKDKGGYAVHANLNENMTIVVANITALNALLDININENMTVMALNLSNASIVRDTRLYTNLSTLMQNSSNITCAYSSSNEWQCSYNGTSMTDTHAGTICAGDTTYLSGEDNCNDIDAIYWDECADAYACGWWNEDADIAADEIGEGKINFTTACPAGNHLYVLDYDLACEPDAGGVTEAWIQARFVNVSWVNWTEAIGNLSSIGNWTADKGGYAIHANVDTNISTLNTLIDTNIDGNVSLLSTHVNLQTNITSIALNISTYLNLSGTNANQNINISPHNLTIGRVLILDGSGVNSYIYGGVVPDDYLYLYGSTQDAAGFIKIKGDGLIRLSTGSATSVTFMEGGSDYFWARRGAIVYTSIASTGKAFDIAANSVSTGIGLKTACTGLGNGTCVMIDSPNLALNVSNVLLVNGTTAEVDVYGLVNATGFTINSTSLYDIFTTGSGYVQSAWINWTETVGNLSSIGNWTADKPNYATHVNLQTNITSVALNFSTIGNWTADRGGYAVHANIDSNVSALQTNITVLSNNISSIGNWTADKGSYATHTNVDGNVTSGVGLWVNATPWTYLNETYIQNVNISSAVYINDTTKNVNMTGNLTVQDTHRICLNNNCSSSIRFNGTHTIIN